VASAARMCWKISSARWSLSAASAVRPAARALQPRPASARAWCQELPIWRGQVQGLLVTGLGLAQVTASPVPVALAEKSTGTVGLPQ
jgi:hypothetical protein